MLVEREGGIVAPAKERKNKELTREDYRAELRRLQIELVRLQKHVIKNGLKVLVILEGRDAAGKDGTIKRIVQHMSPRETRVVALGKPTEQETHTWYFQRFVPHLPVPEEIVLFNRSWYNRAGVERVMGFCSEDEYRTFMELVVPFEHMLVNSGVIMLKYYLDISHAEQRKRLRDRRDDPLSQWKVSPIDEMAQKLWKKYSVARDQMLARTHNPVTPWYVVRADDKRHTRLNVIRHILWSIPYHGRKRVRLRPDPDQIFQYDRSYLDDGMIAK